MYHSQLKGKININQSTTVEDVFWEDKSVTTLTIVKATLETRTKMKQ